jgi:hypothetical protein
LHLVYQRDTGGGGFGVYRQVYWEGTWSDPEPVSDLPGSQWCPAVAVTGDGRIAVAWDGYASGSYDVYLRYLDQDGAAHPTIRLSNDGRFNAHVSLAPAPDADLWIAWNRGGAHWGKDNEPYRRGRIMENNYLHARRDLVVRRMREGRIWPVYPDLQFDVLDYELPGQHCERPRLLGCAEGRLYLAFRYNQGAPRGGGRSEKRGPARCSGGRRVSPAAQGARHHDPGWSHRPCPGRAPLEHASGGGFTRGRSRGPGT